MKRYLKAALISLFVLLALLGNFTISTIIETQSYGRLINYVGIVRGATQRLVKLELEKEPNDELVQYLDGILDELNTGEGQYGLPLLSDANYDHNLLELTSMWGKLKTEITEFRANGNNEKQLLSLSEEYFMLANDTVFSAEAYSSGKIRGLLHNCIIMLAIMAVTWIFIFWAASRKMLRLENTNQTLNDLTRRDPLTGVYQLDVFVERAQKLLDETKTADFQEKLAIVYTDFADFKYINDVFGYDFGNELLAEYGKIMMAGLSKKEICGRVSADNFVLLIRYQNKQEIVSRRRLDDQKLSEFLHESRNQGSLSTYCGICCVEDVIEDLDINGFLTRANFARKTVKNGTNQNYVFYNEEIRRRLWKEKDIERKMKAALENQEFQVYYQPKVNLKTGKISCAEALVRWCSGDHAMITPDDFIPVFERKLMIDRLDQYVFERVCRWIRHLLDEGIQALPVSVNISRLQFYNENFVKRYVEIRDSYQIPPELLEIEFTESIVFDNTSAMLQIVKALRNAGFTCSIDDFGKGYSSLGMLKNLPVDILKIDRIFFLPGENRNRDLAVVEGIVEMARRLQIKTVAEGVEDAEQVEFLKSAGCDYVQGYYFYHPMPQSEYEKLLA